MTTLRTMVIEFIKARGPHCPTWWFKFTIPAETKAIRKELEAMEREGLVTSDRRQTNNTKWALVERCACPRCEEPRANGTLFCAPHRSADSRTSERLHLTADRLEFMMQRDGYQQ